MRALLAALALLLAAVAPAVAASYANVTIMTWDSGHGTQVEYYDAKGNTFLWYPGNRVVLPGRWKTEGKNICFAYGGGTYNPVTGHRGGGFECMPAALHQQAIVDRAKGDVFGLAKRKAPPFSLPRERTTISALLKGDRPAKGSTAPTPARTHAASNQEQCREIIARAETGKDAQFRAALLYFHGQVMGERCTNMKVDYVKSLTMLKALGRTAEYNSLVKSLKSRAASGNPKAIAALNKLGIPLE